MATNLFSMRTINCLVLLLLLPCVLKAQASDSVSKERIALPKVFITQVDKKAGQYYARITRKTEKTLEKFVKWEHKIQRLLEKVNPKVAHSLFEDNQLTFSKLLEQYRQGKVIADDYGSRYNGYMDKINTGISFLEKENAGAAGKLKKLRQDMDTLDAAVKDTEVLGRLIRERKRELAEAVFSHLGKSKYIARINKEAFYYAEALKNYKEIFSDQKKAEALAFSVLNKIPAFEKFVRENSQLASLFGSYGTPGGSVSNTLTGLQTRANVTALLQQQMASANTGAMQQVSQNLQSAQAQISSLRSRMNVNGTGEIPDFKPNMQKTKTFSQRIVYGFDVQFGRSNTYLPSTSNISATLGYKINDKSIAGVGASFRIGLGKSLDKMKFTGEGAGVRAYMDWKLKKQFFISGVYEQNYFKNAADTQFPGSAAGWRQAGLIGISKKVPLKGKKTSKVQLLYDVFSRQHIPATQPFIFRIGISFE
jgi:hypothetical protein